MGLSFISMLGGTITIIGSSTNLIALSLLEPTLTISMFEFTKYSVPVGIIGIIYLTIISNLNKIKSNNNKRCLLNNEKLDIQLYFFKIQMCSSLIGNNVKKSKLQEFCGLQLVGIERDNDFNCRPVRSFVNLQENDILIYIGSNFKINSSCVKNELNTYSMLEIQKPDYQSNIASGIIPRYFSKIINQTIIDINFKTTFNMVLLGIIRNKKLIKLNIKNEKILSGDTIIVYGINGYSNMISNLNRICIKPYSISKISNKCTSNKNYDNILLFISLILIIINGVFKFINLTLFCIIICLLFLLIGNIDIIDIYNSFNTYRSVIIGTSLSLFITKSLEISNVLFNISKVLSKIVILDRWFQYFLVHFMTSCLSILLSNASVIAIMIPIIKNIYLDSIYLKPIVLCCIHGASCCFASPTGYHTNLMINDIGGFKCLDFLFIGIPLHILISFIFSSLVYWY
jgi:di/tricarboxylate transporter